NWNLANGAGILLVTPLLPSMLHGNWKWMRQPLEEFIFSGISILACGFAFLALFSVAPINLTFIVFPVVIYAAVRFGLRELALVFVLVLMAVYGALALQPRALPAAEMASAIWFAQAFCWVLAATGLLVTALME